MSAIQRFIDIFVNNAEAVNKLEQTEQQINKVDKATTQVTQSTDLLTKKTQHNSKSIRENGGAMGFLGAATRGASNDIKDAIEAVEGLGVSFKGLNGAIAASLIGALSIVILELITNWDKWKGVIDGSTASLENLKRTIDGIDQSLERLNNNFSKEEASLQNIIDLMKAKGATQDELIEKEKELNALQTLNAKTNQEALIAKRDEYRRVLDNELPEFLKIYDEIGLVERNLKAGLLPDETIWGRQINSLEETQEYLAKLNISLAEYAKGEDDINKTAKEYLDINKQIISGRIKINNLENDPKVLQAQREREEGLKRFNDLLDSEKKKYGEIAALLRKNLDIIKDINKETYQFQFDENGEVFRKLMSLSDIFYKNQKAFYDANKEAAQLQATYKKIVDTIKNDPTLNEDEKKKALELAKKEKDEKLKSLNLTEKEINLMKKAEESEKALENQINKTVKSVNDKFNSVSDVTGKQLELNDLQLELFNLENGLFEFEKGFEKNGKWLDNRTDNSTKYAQIAERINKIYEIRIKLENTIEKNKLDELDKKSIDLDKKILDAEERKKKYDDELAAERAKGTDVNSEKYLEIAKKQNEADAQLQDFRDQAAQIQIDRTTVMAQTIYTIEELAAKKKIELENNTLNEKQAIREEELERQQTYAEKSIAIAEEASNMLNAIATLGGKKSEEFAKAALKIQKVAGVARVVIATQEEIRGIWANPALSALPPAIGNARKALLTAAAGARSAISIATILSQKIGSSPSSTSIGTEGPTPEANFNVVAASGTNQLAATIASQQNRPVNAYVVGSDVSTAQALDRNRITTATFL